MHLATATLVRFDQWTNRTFVLPLVIFYPTSRCNSRCVSCDWWKGERRRRSDAWTKSRGRGSAAGARHARRAVLRR